MVLETHCAVVQAVMNALVWSAVAGPRLGAWCLSILTSAFFAPSAYGLTPSFSSCPSIKEGLPSGQGPSLVQALACLLSMVPMGIALLGGCYLPFRVGPFWDG